ncbi:DoxX family membrane protein [Urechidicola croceus]|uniref:DoxX family protein n=1 Tax=Urechidicola croceus TaxID=1850246 RepID=A0A1D8P980_9FLAO|nr:DoxX family membrane protein [Urechidicola croceus]AOW21121.1 DoxX family protein [Urechidicola croceus]
MSIFNNHSAEILILIFLIVTFLQSGIDKITDWKGNVSFITDHFKNSPLKNMVPMLLGIILIIEIIAGVLMVVGVYQLATSGVKNAAVIGLELSAITLIMLLLGQRLAKDYAGAMSLTVYFILTVFGIYLLQ